MPFAFPSCLCEEALAEADAAIQMGRGGHCPMLPLDCRVAYAPRDDKAGGVGDTKGGKTYEVPTESSSRGQECGKLLLEEKVAASLGFHFGYPSAD